MKYRLLKDKITSIGWYSFPLEERKGISDVTECFGFSHEIQTYMSDHVRLTLDTWPDIVEEVVVGGLIDFDDWDEEVKLPLKNDFFFYHDKRIAKFNDKPMQIQDNKQHLVHISRLWVEPVL